MNEVVLVLGIGAAGKSTHVKKFVDTGYHRINRDELGGSLDDLVNHLDAARSKGLSNIVMDNTYATIQSRKSAIDWAKENGYTPKCVWINTSLEDAQLNACLRMVQRRGRLLTPEEMKKEKDPNLFPPVALFAYKKNFEKPTTAEGFSTVEKVEFVRTWGEEYKNSALIFDCDGVFRHSGGKEKFPCSPEEVVCIQGRGAFAKDQSKKYDYLFGISNQSGIAKKKLTDEQCRATFAQTNKLIGLDIDWLYCPHNVPPISCYCRKPSSGLGALLIQQHKLLPSKCVFVGDQTSDATFSVRCGFQFVHERDFFK